MSNILAYPAIPEVSEADLLIISDISEDGNPTRTVSVQALVGGSTAPLGLTVNGTSGAATLIDNILNIPIYTGGGGGTVTNVSYSTNINAFAAGVTNSSSSPDITLTLNGGSVGQFLRQDGEWATVPSGGGTMSQWNVDDGGAGGFQVANNNTVTVGGSTKISVSTNVASKSITWTHKDTARTDTTSTASPAAGATFTVVDSITQDATGHPTAVNVKTVTMPASGGGGVNSVAGTTPGTSIGTPIVVDPTTGSVLVKSMAYNGTTNVGHVPTGGGATTFLRGDGTWVVPSGGGAGTTYDLASAQDGSNVDITLTPSTGAVDTVQLTAGTGITLADDGNNNITIISAASGTGLWSTSGNDIYNNNSRAVVVGRTSLIDTGAIMEVQGRISMIGIGMFIGQSAGENSTGSANTGVGTFALQTVTSGVGNTAIGRSALTNTTSNGNTAVGSSAGAFITTGSGNTAVGRNALRDNTTGAGNVAIGEDAMGDTTTAAYNTVVGSLAYGNAAATGIYNVIVGRGTMQNATTANYTVCIGAAAMDSTTTGTHNTVIGSSAFTGNVTGSYNIVLGRSAGTGANSGGLITAPTNSMYLGASTRSAVQNATNEIVIGYNASGKGTNTVVLGNNDVETTYLKGVVLLEGGVFAALPASPVGGMRTYIIDGGTPTYGGIASGGGSNVLPVFYNGSNWIYA